jgi:RNA recognition motif-containing protein
VIFLNCYNELCDSLVPDDFRIFCGDLGNDVTDEILTRAFSKYQSFLKAKVVRDKRSNKTKGFGFVSFKDPQDFIKAMKEMNGKYMLQYMNAFSDAGE